MDVSHWPRHGPLSVNQLKNDNYVAYNLGTQIVAVVFISNITEHDFLKGKNFDRSAFLYILYFYNNEETFLKLKTFASLGYVLYYK